MINIAEQIKSIRTRLGLSQKELAEKIESNRANIANYETGRAIPSGITLLKIYELVPDEQAN